MREIFPPFSWQNWDQWLSVKSNQPNLACSFSMTLTTTINKKEKKQMEKKMISFPKREGEHQEKLEKGEDKPTNESGGNEGC